MAKRLIIFLSFLAYALTLTHSIVPHHHHDRQVSGHHHHSSGDHHHDDHEQKSVSHAFADAFHFPGSETVIHAQQLEIIQKISSVSELHVDDPAALLARQLKPPDLNTDPRSACCSSAPHSLFLLRAPPLA